MFNTHKHYYTKETPKTDEILRELSLINKKLDNLKTDQTKVDSLANTISDQTDELSDAVSENTPDT